jgi:hypothetical protein
MVNVPARSLLPMIAFRDALCITHNPVNGTVSKGREGPARFAGCRITLRTVYGIIRKAALWNLCRYRHKFQDQTFGEILPLEFQESTGHPLDGLTIRCRRNEARLTPLVRPALHEILDDDRENLERSQDTHDPVDAQVACKPGGSWRR